MIQVYYGDGKGKTSALNGAALRANVKDYKVKIYRFLKGKAGKEDAQLLKLGITVIRAHTQGVKFVYQMTNEEKSAAETQARKGMAHILANAKPTDVILLDEFIDLSDRSVDFLTEDEQIAFIRELKGKVAEIIITGHRLFNDLEKVADLVTDFKKEKHYYDKGVKARIGFEY